MINLIRRLLASAIIIISIVIVGWFAVFSGQYSWHDIGFIIVGCVIFFWVFDILLERLK